MRQANLVLHCGAAKAERAEVEVVPTPDPTQTWTPIPHLTLIQQVEETLRANSLSVVTQAHALTRGGARYFGLMQIQNGAQHQDYSWTLGLRNSHDMSFPAGLAIGMNVFICDNLSFSGEIKFGRKHTRYIVRDLPSLTQTAIGRLMSRWHHQDQRVDAYKNSRIEPAAAHDLIVRGLDVGACTITQVPKILKEWREPQHEEFRDRTAWSLFNSFTEALKGSLNELPRRTERLHGLLDTHVGLAAFDAELPKTEDTVWN